MKRDDAVTALHLQVAIENGPTFGVGPGDDTVLRAALRAGITFPYECSVGGCGACRFDLLEGAMDKLWEAAPGLSARDRQRGKRLACQSRPTSDCRIRVRLGGEGEVAATRPRRSQARLIDRRPVTGDLWELRFQVEQAQPFLPGQYALLYPAGVTGARAYSMSNLADGSGEWHFIVRRTPNGSGSAALCESLSVGQTIDIDGPFGHAHLRPGTRDLVCVAGGSGLGPMLSVARGALAEGGERRIHFLLGLRNESELGAAAEVEALGQGRIQTTVVLSNPLNPSRWTGPQGFVHAAIERVLSAPLPEHDFYFAGPPPMIEALQELLMLQHRVPFEQIHFDRYV